MESFNLLKSEVITVEELSLPVVSPIIEPVVVEKEVENENEATIIITTTNDPIIASILTPPTIKLIESTITPTITPAIILPPPSSSPITEPPIASTSSALQFNPSQKRPLSDSSSSLPLPLPLAPTAPLITAGGEEVDIYQNEHSQAYKSAKSAMEWNGLLTWARKVRGPQWDYATSQYHVDSNSAEYWTGIPRKFDPEAEALLQLQQQQYYQQQQQQHQARNPNQNQNQYYNNNNNNNNNYNNNGPSTPSNQGQNRGQQYGNNNINNSNGGGNNGNNNGGNYNNNNNNGGNGNGGNGGGGGVYDSGRPRRTRAAMSGGR